METHIYFNPLNVVCKSIVGAIKQGEKIQFNLYCIKNSTAEGLNTFSIPEEKDCVIPENNAYFHINKDGEPFESIPMEKRKYGWSITLTISQTGLYYYTFFIENVGYVSCGNLQLGCITSHPVGYLLTVYDKTYKTPEWFKGGNMYQIFPDRFNKIGTMPDIKGHIERKDWGGLPSFRPNERGKVLNNDFFGGNLQGIASKLQYLKDLGITIIYLNPIFEAKSNHRYDTSDYMKIDPVLGNENDFKHLIEQAEKHGIKVILDGVFNHTGDNSVYFNKYGEYPNLGAYQSKESPYYSWYSFQEFPNKYESWWGIDILPEVNEKSTSYQDFIFGKEGVLKKWLSFGIGGYRLDVADELPDFFLQKLRKSVKESNENAIIIGEVWEDASDKIAYSKRREYLQGHELDSVMNYPLKEGIISYIQSGNALKLIHTIRVLIDHYPKQTLDCLMNILGTHDTARILTVLGGIYCHNKEEMAKESAYLTPKSKEKAIEKLKMAAVLQFTMPGVPCLYYGDENGMEGHIDPFCRQCFDWDNTNTDLLQFYQKLGNLRLNNREIFKDGEFIEIFIQDGLIFFKRENEHGSVYVYVNNSSKNYLFKIQYKLENLLSEEKYENVLEVQPYQFGILKKINER